MPGVTCDLCGDEAVAVISDPNPGAEVALCKVCVALFIDTIEGMQLVLDYLPDL